MDDFFGKTKLLIPKPLRYVSIKDINAKYYGKQEDINDNEVKEDKENALFPGMIFIEGNSLPIFSSSSKDNIDTIFHEDFMIKRTQRPIPHQHVDNVVLSRKRIFKACSF